MADRPRFGPAGIPLSFSESKAPTSALPQFLREEGLDALEYEAVRWGQRPQIKQVEAERLGINAAKHDVWLTIHGSYYINLLGSTETLEASKNRLIACATAAQWMKAHTITFHPGYYSQRRSRKHDLQLCIKALKEVAQSLKTMSIETNLGPETAGKLSQLGSLEEVIVICEAVEQTEPVIDWGHLHARLRGNLRTANDFQKVIEEIENRLSSTAAKNLHCHFSHVEFTFRGERRHHPLENPRYGPKFESLAEVIAKLDLNPVIISESPLPDEDAKRMRDIVLEKLKTHQLLQ